MHTTLTAPVLDQGWLLHTQGFIFLITQTVRVARLTICCTWDSHFRSSWTMSPSIKCFFFTWRASKDWTRIEPVWATTSIVLKCFDNMNLDRTKIKFMVIRHSNLQSGCGSIDSDDSYVAAGPWLIPVLFPPWHSHQDTLCTRTWQFR